MSKLHAFRVILLWLITLGLIVLAPNLRAADGKKIAAPSGAIKVGKLWVYPDVSNEGFIGRYEYPSGSRDFYLVQTGMALSFVNQRGRQVLFGGNLGEELQFNFFFADGLQQRWQQLADGVNHSWLRATSNLASHTSGARMEIQTEVLGFSEADYDDFLIMRYTFRNLGNEDFSDFYFGSLMPADVGASSVANKDLDDLCAYDAELALAYMFDNDGDNGVTPYLVGQALLAASPAGSTSDAAAIFSQGWTTFHYYLLTTPVTGSADLHNRMTSGIAANTPTPDSYTVLSAVGPYTLKAGGKLIFTMAVVYGEGLSGLRTNTQNARDLVQADLQIPPEKLPPPIPTLRVEGVQGRHVRLSWNATAMNEPDFDGFHLYKSEVSAIGPWRRIFESPSATTFTDLGQIGFPQFYAVTASDRSGNESGLWGEVNRTLQPVYPVGEVAAPGEVKVVPNPYLGSATWELADYESRLYFTHLPERCTIYIYTLTGDLVDTLPHNLPGDPSPDNSGDEAWDMVSKNAQSIVSGLYLFRVEAESGRQQVGRFAVVKGQR